MSQNQVIADLYKFSVVKNDIFAPCIAKNIGTGQFFQGSFLFNQINPLVCPPCLCLVDSSLGCVLVQALVKLLIYDLKLNVEAPLNLETQSA